MSDLITLKFTRPELELLRDVMNERIVEARKVGGSGDDASSLLRELVLEKIVFWLSR